MSLQHQNKPQKTWTDLDWERLAIIYLIQDSEHSAYIHFTIGITFINIILLLIAFIKLP